MADELVPTAEQHDIEMPDGIVLSGMGGNPEELRMQFDERHDERAPEPPADEPKPAAAATTDEPAASAEPPQLSRGRKRYADLTREREEAQRTATAEKTRADAAEARAKELEARLAAPPQPRAEPTREPAAAVDTPAIRSKPVEAEVGSKYATYADFIEDLADWKAERRIADTVKDLDARSTARIEADRASRSRSDLVNQEFTRGRSVYPDFDAVLDSVSDIEISPAHQLAIMSVPEFGHVMYGLAKDRAKLQAFIKIKNPVQAGLELAKLIPSAAVASPASTAPVVRTTNAPAPVQPVGASTRTTSVSSAELADHGDDFDASGYRDKRAKELGRRPVR